MASVALSKSKRFNEIFHILLRHDFASLLRDLAVYGRESRRPQPIATNGSARPDVPERVRRLMEDLGPTFIKMGQLLGTRPDLIPQPFVEEFKKLYDQTTPSPFEAIRTVIEAELGRPVSSVFSSFDSTAIASASIGQVHRAVLKTGEAVAVKVQHPGIQERMATDFEILRILVRFTERVFAKSRVWQPVNHLEEIRQMLAKELDYRNELRVQKEVEANFEDEPTVKIPHVHEQLSSARVLVMEYVQGIKFRSAHQPELVNIDRKAVAQIITNAMAKQVFVDRLFHADPSPGNLLIISGNQVCFLDFGAFGVVTKRRSRLILDLLLGLSAGSAEEVARSIVDLCDVKGEYDAKRFLRDVEKIADYHEREKASVADPVLLQMLIDAANSHRMVLPADFMLITRALYQFDGICKALDPDYELVAALEPFVGSIIRERLLNPEHQVENLRHSFQELARIVSKAPGQVEKVLERLAKGEIGAQVEIKGFHEHRVHQMRMVFIVTFTLLVGFVLVGSAIGYGLGGAGFIRDYTFLALFGFLFWFLAFVYASGLFRRKGF